MSRWTPEACWLGHEAPADTFENWCAAHAGRPAVVWLGSGLLTPLLVPPDRPLRGEPPLRAYLRRVLSHYGVPPDAALATWRSGAGFGGIALSGIAVAELRAIATRHRVRLRGLRPGWALALGMLWRQGTLARRGPARLRVDEAGCCTRLMLEDGRLVALTVHWGDPPAVDGEHRWSPVARGGSGGPSVPDFLAAPGDASRRAGWALAACGLLTLAVAGWEAIPQELPPPAVAAIDRPNPAAALQLSRGDAAHDWGEVFAAAEQASVPGLQWLRLEHEGARGTLRLTGVAPDVTPALLAVDRLAARAGWRQALLAQTEPVASGGLRVELHAGRVVLVGRR